MRRLAIRSLAALLACAWLTTAYGAADVPALPAPRTVPSAGDPGVVRAIVMLIAMLAVAIGIHYLSRRYLPGLSKRLPFPIAGLTRRRLKVVEVMRFNPRSSAMLIEADGRLLLIGVCAGGITLIAEMGKAADTDAKHEH